MAERAENLSVLSRLGLALNRLNFPSFCLKPLQVKCFEYLLKGFDVIAVLPTGFGRSLLFQLLPDFLPVKSEKNIVLVACPLNSIMEDQLKLLKDRGVSADVLELARDESFDCESLFHSENDGPERESPADELRLKNPSRNLVKGDIQIIFSHPEANMEIWGKEFRREFKDLSAVKAFFPHIPVMALTATAPPHLLNSLKESLALKANCKVISANPNRMNIYLDKKVRMSSHHGFASYDQILLPIAHGLAVHAEKYPMTIIYFNLKYCGYAYSMFEIILKDKQYVRETRDPSGRLFAQFHAPQTTRMKKAIIAEIRKLDSRSRVLFATSALGMGVDAPSVEPTSHLQVTLSHMCKRSVVLEEQESLLEQHCTLIIQT